LSRRRLDKVCIDGWAMQNVHGIDWDQRILDLYCQMYDAYFDELPLIPNNQFCEVGFEELEDDPINVMAKVYAALRLPDFSVVESELRSYVKSLSNYKKNTFPKIEPPMRSRLIERWRPYFERWGYSATL
jgi:hypothetical protein